MEQSLLQIALTLFLIFNPIGIAPVILGYLKHYPFARQRAIMLREAFIAMIVALFFQFFGEMFMNILCIEHYTVSFCGGILLLLIALEMIYPRNLDQEMPKPASEPFIVPIATPLLAGPGLLAMIMLFARNEPDILKVTGAVVLAGAGVMIVMAFAPYVQKALGKKGMSALEQLMGLVLSMISIRMIEQGIELFIDSLQKGVIS